MAPLLTKSHAQVVVGMDTERRVHVFPDTAEAWALVAGKSGKTKFTIENATRTRIVIADQHIRILGSFQNIKIARDALCNLILGSPPGKVYSRLRSITARLSERF